MALGRRRVGGSRPSQARAKRWRQRQITGTVRSDKAIQMGADTYQVVSSLLQEGADNAAATMWRRMDEFFEEVRKEWPHPGHDTSGRSTGYSRSRLALRMQQIGDSIVVSIRNDADYAIFIRQNRYKPRHLFRRVIFFPADKVAVRLAREIRDVLADPPPGSV